MLRADNASNNELGTLPKGEALLFGSNPTYTLVCHRLDLVFAPCKFELNRLHVMPVPSIVN